jgi:hypothetical protein
LIKRREFITCSRRFINHLIARPLGLTVLPTLFICDDEVVE